MRVNVSGILSDYQGRVLLQQAGPKTLVPISRPLVPGALPAATLALAFREETSLIVMPVRLTGLHYDEEFPGGELTFCFRCTMRGGDLRVPEGKPPAGFFDYLPLPAGLSPKHKRQVDLSLHHAGGPPVMMNEPAGLGARLGRLIGGRRPEPENGPWTLSVRLLVGGGDYGVAWTRSGLNGLWQLPTTAVGSNEAPWTAAERLLKSLQPDWNKPVGRVTAVQLTSDCPEMTFIFVIPTDAPALPQPSGEQFIIARPDLASDQFASEDVRLSQQVDWAATEPVFSIR